MPPIQMRTVLSCYYLKQKEVGLSGDLTPPVTYLVSDGQADGPDGRKCTVGSAGLSLGSRCSSSTGEVEF